MYIGATQDPEADGMVKSFVELVDWLLRAQRLVRPFPCPEPGALVRFLELFRFVFRHRCWPSCGHRHTSLDLPGPVKVRTIDMKTASPFSVSNLGES